MGTGLQKRKKEVPCHFLPQVAEHKVAVESAKAAAAEAGDSEEPDEDAPYEVCFILCR